MIMDEDQWMYDSVMSKEVDMNDQNEGEASVFATRDDVLHWARFIAYEIGFVAVIMRSGQYRAKKKDLVRTCTGSRKCGCPFKLRAKPVVGGKGWMGNLICGSHNHELVKSLVEHSYIGRLTKDGKIIVVDMTNSMVKPRNILLTLKEHNAKSYTTIKQIYNARNAYCSSIKGSLFFKRDELPEVIVTDRNLELMNAAKTIFPEATNLLCRFHIDKNVKAKCKTLVGKKNAWDYVMEA
ncbi:hypothetical protein HKD37_07G018732 [Glycine soja]